MAPVAYAAIQSARAHTPGPVLLMTPRGKRFTQKDARRLSQTSGFSLLCPRFEGIDERIYSMVDEQISVGDFILSTGDMAAFVLLDAVIRLLPDVLGNAASLVEESFLNQLSDQEYPQYTRPQVFRGQHVPPVLTSGHHQHIQHWRTLQAQRLSSQETCSEGLECASGDVLKEQR
jgi:tRNA (guanine37-N1)-methyltransferase